MTSGIKTLIFTIGLTLLPISPGRARAENRGATEMQFQVKERDYVPIREAWEGEQGSGKSTSASLQAIGLHRESGGKDPVWIIDTENKFHKNEAFRFKKAGVPYEIVSRSRSFQEAVTIFQKAMEGGTDVLMIDTVTHLYEDCTEIYMLDPQNGAYKCGACDSRGSLRGGIVCVKCSGRRWLPAPYPSMAVWGERSRAWRYNFNDRITASPMNLLICGRIQDDVVGVEEEVPRGDKGETETKRTTVTRGVKMQAGKNTGYEPDTLVLMQTVTKNLQATTARGKQLVTNRGIVLKAPAQSDLQAKVIDMPNWENFGKLIWTPYQEARISRPKTPLIMAGEEGTQATAQSRPSFDTPRAHGLSRAALIDELMSYLQMLYPGNTKEGIAGRPTLIREIFGTPSLERVTQAYLIYPAQETEDAKAHPDYVKSLEMGVAEMKERWMQVERIRAAEAVASGELALTPATPRAEKPPAVVIRKGKNTIPAGVGTDNEK